MPIQSVVFPASWKIGQIVPIYKKGNRADFASYRPVKLHPLLFKIMEHIVHQQLTIYLDSQDILHPAQHGFRNKWSCCSVLLSVEQSVNNKKCWNVL